MQTRQTLDDTTHDLLRTIERQSHAVAAREREVIQAGPFRAFIDPETDLIWLNYAMPTTPIGDPATAGGALAELRREFIVRGRTPRFEFTEALWPDLPPLLERHGFRLQVRHAMMLCSPQEFQPVAAPDVRVRLLGFDDETSELMLYFIVRDAGFGLEIGRPTAELLDRFRGELRRGEMRCAIARRAGMTAGAGCTLPKDGIAELAGVATLPTQRRHGVAATLTSVLVRDHFERGGTVVWLSAGDEIAEAVYRKVGFRTVGMRGNYIEAGYTGPE